MAYLLLWRSLDGALLGAMTVAMPPPVPLLRHCGERSDEAIPLPYEIASPTARNDE